MEVIRINLKKSNLHKDLVQDRDWNGETDRKEFKLNEE